MLGELVDQTDCCMRHCTKPGNFEGIRGIESVQSSLKIFSMGTAREEIINLYDTLPARYNLGFRDIQEERKPIGKGMFGSVHRGRWGGRGVAVKKFDMKNTDHNFNLASKEMSRMIRLRHHNVLNVYGFYFVAEGLVLKCSMVMELMECDLYKYIEQKQHKGKGRCLPLTDDEVVYIIAEIARGMKYVHENGYSHRDLKPQNVLMRRSAVLTGSHLDVKIADFGSSELMRGGHCNRNAGTPCYKAPEQFLDGDATLRRDKMDVYSFGCLCFKLWTGKDPPFKNHAELLELWRQRCARSLPGDVEIIITECLAIDPDARPGFSKISGDLDAVLNERQLEQVPHREDVTHEEAADLVVSRKMWKRCFCLVSSSTSQQRLERKNQERQWIVEALGLDHGVDGLDYADYVIPSEELDVRRRIRGGAEANVFEVNWKGTLCALKVYESGSEYFMDGEASRFKMLPTLIHDNVVSFLGYSLTTSVEGNRVFPSILMEYLACDLSLLIEDSHRRPLIDSFPKHIRWKIMKGIAEGMKFLHGQDCVHGDLKPANVMVNLPDPDVDAGYIRVKLIDFGGAFKHLRGGTTVYRAPELLQAYNDGCVMGSIECKKADVYSFAITCSDILGKDKRFTLEVTLREFCKKVIAGMRPALPKETSQGLQDLIKRCWSQDLAERPSFCDICEFFSV